MNAPTGNLFPKPDAVASAARHMDVLRRLADTSTPLPATFGELSNELGHRMEGLKAVIEKLERDGLVLCQSADPLDLTLTRTGALAALGVGVATGEAEVDLDARLIEHSRLKPNPLNPRKTFDEVALAELADNIEANLHRGGVLQNLVVHPSDNDGEHVIFAGERRWRAVRLLIERGVVDADFRLPCRVREPDDLETEAQTAFVALSENQQRRDLSMLEQARAYKVLVEKGGLSAAEAARRTGRDKRTVQEFIKVLAEGSPDAISACERGDLKWEELRDSVKSLKLSPAQALIMLEVAARMDTEEAAVEAEDGTPPWIEIAFLPMTGPHIDLAARGLLQFQVVDSGPLCRLRTDNPRLEGWLDASFARDPDERRSLAPEQLAAILFQARTNELGSFRARELEQSGKCATAWLNVEPPTIAEVQGETPAAALPSESAPPNAGEALYQDARELVIRDRNASTSYIQRKLQLGYNTAAAIVERMEREGVVGPANHAGKREVLAPAPALQPEGPQEEVHEPREQHEPAAAPADVLEVRAVRGQDAAPAALDPDAAQPTPRQRMILAEILHKTLTSPVKIGQGESGFVDGALISKSAQGDGDVRTLTWNGLAQIHGGVGPDLEPAIRLSYLGIEALGLLAGVTVGLDLAVCTRDEARKDAGLTLGQRHELQQTGRYAWDPLNTAPPKPPLKPQAPAAKPAAPDRQDPAAGAPAPASAARDWPVEALKLVEQLADDARWAATWVERHASALSDVDPSDMGRFRFIRDRAAVALTFASEAKDHA